MGDDRKKIPAEAVDLYTRFIHGEIDRRAFVRGVSRYAVAGLTASVIVEALMPNYALGQQVARNDERIRADYVTVPSPDGYGSIRGYLVRPFSADSRSAEPALLPGVIVIHENRGLNPHTEDVARRFALANFMAFAPDTLTSVGGYPGDDFKGGQLFASLDREKMTKDLVAAARWLKARPDCNGRIAATGFCFGGGQSNLLAGLMGPDLAAAAPFYGGATPPELVPAIEAAILIHHGALDTRLAEGYPAQIAELERHGVRHEGHLWPDSVHGFFNDATPERYNATTAAEAWDRTLQWFNSHTRTPVTG
ncbi:dienelactone hydrolase family protein [Brevundimonas subvibrioides]|uniref:Carboxymethylenebutenolidase n=1 Tax=Brevundimonas subvibrioides (strain ATCC 15264 / DSM 4735 / LMG 14903 / NBRC 16000 / CB 81) TaxID=633149 RepID=D9QLJ9_BRESC|nr:dienelactone hydrolase family protein [Brevundimonas subvibrioides]ADL01893.1 carboxymethylenebutenolidase [Brevundimonas subvibrioides ATCC 15264]